MGIFEKLARAYQVRDSSTYRETVRSVERIAGASYALLAGKPREEQVALLGRVTELSVKLDEAVGHETPLVVARTLLSAIRTHDEIMQHHAKA